MDRDVVHPYIPNSVPGIKTEMLEQIARSSTEELYASIPEEIRLVGSLDVPDGLIAECDLVRHVEELLAQNVTCSENLSFLGGGCWNHYVPAVCDEIARRGEFLTAYHDGPRSMKGSYQAQFEFQTMLGELVGMEMVSTTTYDWGSSAASALLMAQRMTGRLEILVPRTISPQRLRQIKTIGGGLTIGVLDYDRPTGALDTDGLKSALSDATAAVYVEVPAYLGFLEPRVAEIAELAHQHGALFVVGVDPVSLGVLEAPGSYGADMVCGDLQPLGIHMSYGGGVAGFIATPHEDQYIAACPTLLVSILETERQGEYLFDWVNFGSISYGLRDKAKDFAGTTQGIWAIVAGVYLALMGPTGMRELGETIMDRTHYAIERLSAIDGVQGSLLGRANFKEFVVNFDGTGKSVAEINRGLLQRAIFGGVDLCEEFPELGASALWSVTERHRKADIDRLVDALEEVVR